MQKYFKKKTCLLMRNININPLDTDTDPDVLQLRDILSLNLFIPYLLQPTRFARNSKTLIDNLFLFNWILRSYVQQKQPQIIFFNIAVKEYLWRKIHELSTLNLLMFLSYKHRINRLSELDCSRITTGDCLYF